MTKEGKARKKPKVSSIGPFVIATNRFYFPLPLFPRSSSPLPYNTASNSRPGERQATAPAIVPATRAPNPSVRPPVRSRSNNNFLLLLLLLVPPLLLLLHTPLISIIPLTTTVMAVVHFQRTNVFVYKKCTFIKFFFYSSRRLL